MEISGDEIRVEKPPNALDELLLDVVDVFEELDIGYAAVSDYVVVLLGRSRAREDIDVIVERFDAEVAERLAARLREAGYGGRRCRWTTSTRRLRTACPSASPRTDTGCRTSS